MSTFSRYVVVLAATIHFMTACSAQAAPAVPGQPTVLEYQRYRQLPGKLATDREVSDLITASHCISAAQFEVCKEAGLAFWLDASGIVQSVYLYLHNEDGFMPYQGELPFGLKFYDTMGAVEYKLSRQGIGNQGLPNEAAVPDHFHYWAFYREVRVTIIYNSPFADEDATIYAIVLNG